MVTSSSRLPPALLALVCFAIYVAAAVPSLYWLDSSEFAAASWELGVAHPPGHPLAALWGRLFALLPLGSIGFRVAVGQAAAGALAIFALAELGQLVLAGAGVPPALGPWLAAGGAGLFAFTWSHAVQSVRPEVYALQAAASLGAARLALAGAASGQTRPFAAAALLIGLGLANHHVLAAAGALPVLLLVLAQRPVRPRLLTMVACAGLVGLATYLYLPIRAARAPLVNWGDASRIGRFLWLVSARAYAHAIERGTPTAAPLEAMVELTPLVAFAALGGLYLLVRQRASRKMGLFVLGQIVLYGGVSSVIAFYPQNPDSHGYLACALAYLALAAAAFVGIIAGWASGRWPRGAAVACAALALLAISGQLVRRWPRFELRHAYGAERTLAFELADVPPRATLTTSYFQTIFALWYAQSIEGLRPDMDVIHHRFALYPGWRPRLSLPEDRRPAVYDYDLHQPAPAPRGLGPLSALYRVGQPPTAAALSRQDEAFDRLRAGLSRDVIDPETRNFLVWMSYLQARYRCQIGAAGAARTAAHRAETLNGAQTPELAALEVDCTPVPEALHRP